MDDVRAMELIHAIRDLTQAVKGVRDSVQEVYKTLWDIRSGVQDVADAIETWQPLSRMPTVTQIPAEAVNPLSDNHEE